MRKSPRLETPRQTRLRKSGPTFGARGSIHKGRNFAQGAFEEILKLGRHREESVRVHGTRQRLVDVVRMSNARYDRQLRIWGVHGQTRLEAARIAVCGSGACGSETLKNLVLGGIGAYTLIDDARVEDGDYGNSYLVDREGMGQVRAEVVSRLVGELNESVRGSVVTASVKELLMEQRDYFKDFTLIIATQVNLES